MEPEEDMTLEKLLSVQAPLVIALTVVLTGCDGGIKFVPRGHAYSDELRAMGDDVRCEVPDHRNGFRIRTGQAWCSFPGARPVGAIR